MRRNGVTLWSSRWLGSLMLISLIAMGCSSDGDDVMQSDERWDTRGALLAWDGEVWIVDDQPVIVPASLGVDDQRVLGATVDASGTVDESGRRVAEAIDITEGEWPDSSLPAETIEGTIDGVDDSAGVWTVGDQHVVIPQEVRVHDVSDLSAFALGDSVIVAGHRLDDDRIVALDISMLGTSSADDGASDAEPEQPFDPAVFTTPSTDDGTTDDAANDDNDDNEKPGNRNKKAKDKDRD